ncbi:MAG TPA: response regulator transcription factor [Anaerolineales bacterium]|nr:DNA-binding response regulator [Anaerolineae bacterium]HRJ57644.1 response regulator transcription factor [Anaerolineales bacterium]HRK88463.1 response regulator transcription factor [Anaerolineales bacterium]
MIKVLICDDQQLVCEGLATILRASPKIEVVGAAHNGDDALALVEEQQPHIVLMDLKMPGMSGVEATLEIRSRFPSVRVLVLTTYALDEWVADAIRAGASGYLLKDISGETLIESVLGTAQGKTYLDPAVAGNLLQLLAQGKPLPPLEHGQSFTEREREILSLLGLGYTNTRIAEELNLTQATVRNLMSGLLRKLNLEDRTQLALFAVRAGIQ